MHLPLLSLLLLVPCVLHGATASAEAEVLVPLASGLKAALATRGPSAFRLRLLAGAEPPLETPMVGPDLADAAFSQVSNDLGTGISASFGSLLVTNASSVLLLDAAGSVLTKSTLLEGPNNFALSTKGGPMYGGGAEMPATETLTTAASMGSVANLGTFVPYYYSADGYAALGVTDTTVPGPGTGGPNHNEPKGLLAAGYVSNGTHVHWSSQGAFELYLMPAATLELGTRAYYALAGAPRLPPRYAFGFMASRWGWKDRAEIEGVLFGFRSGGFPVDVFIIDFEFFTTQNDYDYQSTGMAFYKDFGFNQATFPSPKEQLRGYRDLGNLRVGVIRKPRLGNTAALQEARARGWTALEERVIGEPAASPNILKRWLNFSRPDVRDWYGQQLQAYLDTGIEFWWNDEGEADYYTFYWWNVAEAAALRNRSQAKRFFSLNRAFVPGMARLGAAVWTGDIAHRWEHLASTPGMMLKWSLSGAPYVACDIGGFWPGPTEDADLVARWYQVGVFMPIMRVHSMIVARPRFPWYWGERHAGVMRQALELRYRLVPYHYSLAHGLYTAGRLWIRPMAMGYPEDATAASLVSQWLDGDLLVAPVLRRDHRKEVYLPAGDWYAFNSTEVSAGPQRLTGPAALEEVPVFVRRGAVVPLAPVVQHTDALPGGPLEVQVYAGASGGFELVEDDGETKAYEAGTVRKTHLAWDEGSRTLSWSVEGETPGPQAFTELFVTLFEPQGVQRSPVSPLGAGGSVKLPGPVQGGSLAARVRLAAVQPALQ